MILFVSQEFSKCVTVRPLYIYVYKYRINPRVSPNFLLSTDTESLFWISVGGISLTIIICILY